MRTVDADAALFMTLEDSIQLSCDECTIKFKYRAQFLPQVKPVSNKFDNSTTVQALVQQEKTNILNCEYCQTVGSFLEQKQMFLSPLGITVQQNQYQLVQQLFPGMKEDYADFNTMRDALRMYQQIFYQFERTALLNVSQEETQERIKTIIDCLFEIGSSVFFKTEIRFVLGNADVKQTHQLLAALNHNSE